MFIPSNVNSIIIYFLEEKKRLPNHRKICSDHLINVRRSLLNVARGRINNNIPSFIFAPTYTFIITEQHL